jgi:hypothetical protein
LAGDLKLLFNREYESLHILNGGGILELDGLKLIKDQGEIKPGDLYIAERNTGPKLLIAKKIMGIGLGGWIQPTELNAYSYDLHECVKVKEVLK